MDLWQCVCGAYWPAGMESRLCPACEGSRRLTEIAHESRVERDELLAALKGLLGVIEADDLIPESVSYMRQARAAVAKAERGDEASGSTD